VLPRAISPGTALAVLVLGYPLVCHLGASQGLAWPGLAWLAGLFAATAWARAGARLPLLALAAATLGIAALAGPALGGALLRLPPILVSGALAIVFGETLRPGRNPLILEIAERARGTLPQGVRAYGRGLTVFWTVAFLALALESLLLALLADDYWWSLFTNLINYGVLALIFPLEYAVRRRVLSDLEHEPFFDYLRGLVRVGLR
jgi:uncharacterized membrane protein